MYSVCISVAVYILLKAVSYYDLSVLSMSEMDFPKKKFGWGGGGWVGGVSSNQVLFWIIGICLLCKAPNLTIMLILIQDSFRLVPIIDDLRSCWFPHCLH